MCWIGAARGARKGDQPEGAREPCEQLPHMYVYVLLALWDGVMYICMFCLRILHLIVVSVCFVGYVRMHIYIYIYIVIVTTITIIIIINIQLIILTILITILIHMYLSLSLSIISLYNLSLSLYIYIYIYNAICEQLPRGCCVRAMSCGR